MLRYIRGGALRLLKSSGIFDMTKNSRWRNQRLLILYYHGIALEEENKWIPPLYMHPDLFEQRLQALRTGKYAVLPVREAVERLYRKGMTQKSVPLTSDDGTDS